MHEITLNEVRQLIASLRTVYAAQFNKQFPATGESAIPLSVVEQIALKTLVGVQQNQFNNALARLLTAGGRFMPSFAEFRTWCIGESWMSPEEAWSRACKFTTDRSVVITQITKYALDEVMYLIEAGQMRAAQDNFFGTYNVMVAKAQLKGRQQEFYTPPLQLEHKEPEHTPVRKYSSIDFEHCLSLPLADRKIKVDLSLIPHFEDREESILWLTNFIGKICEPRKMQRQKKNLH